MRIQTFYKNKILIVLLAATSALSILFNNCSNVELQKNLEASMASANAEILGKLPTPIANNIPYRVIFHVDHSHSMKFSGCTSDLNGIDPKLNADGSTILDCTEANGSDVEAKRYDLILKWISALEDMQLKYAKPIKIAVIPFSGPISTKKNPLLTFEFTDLLTAKKKVEALILQQKNESREKISEKYMFTSVPFPSDSTSSINAMIRNEIKNLETQGLLDSSEFEMISLSDGNFTPLDQYLTEAKRLANCSNAQNSYEAEYCNTELPANFIKTYGKPSDNSATSIATSIESFIKLKEEFPNIKTQYHYVQLNYNTVNDNIHRDLTIMDQALLSLKAKKVDTLKWTVDNNSNQTPFDLATKFTSSKSYYIQNFMVIAHNSFIDANGEQLIDSDGDGLSDLEEKSLKLNPLEARSNVEGNYGKCLDSIFKLYGCEAIRPCDKNLDMDGDGLNQCEEMTISSNASRYDSDSDVILDTFETRALGLSPLFNESKLASAGDSYTDHQNFFANVNSKFALSNVNPKQKVSFELKKIGQEERINYLNQAVTVYLYDLKINNLPLVPTLATTSNLNSAYTIAEDNKNYMFTDRDYMIPFNHSKNFNNFTVLIKVASVENPNEIIWYSQHLSIEYKGINSSSTSLSVDFSKFYQLKYLKNRK